MDFRTIFDSYEEKIPQIAEVTTAEENFKKILDKVAAYSTELEALLQSMMQEEDEDFEEGNDD